MCPAEHTYTTKAGDTCNSIARANHVSSGSLYEINPTLYDCENPGVGLELCLPDACEKLYEVQPGENCTVIAAATGTSWRTIVDYNGMVDQWCSNIWGAEPSWGNTICVSPPGGIFIHIPVNNTEGGGVGGPGGSGDGYADTIVELPPGSVLAKNTTIHCGEFYVVKAGDTCRGIIVNANTPSDLFIAANPSLISAEACNENLKAGSTYCLHPLHKWNETAPSNSTGPAVPSGSPSASKTSSTMPTATSTPVSHPVSLDGRCASNSLLKATCLGSSFGSCCSSYGNCGSTPQHCAIGTCQPEFGTCTGDKPPSFDGTCGSQSPLGAICQGSGFGECCSASGWCGDTADHCGAGCQSGACTQPDPNTDSISTDGMCGSNTPNKSICAGSGFGDCCSASGWCGNTADHCGAGCQSGACT